MWQEFGSKMFKTQNGRLAPEADRGSADSRGDDGPDPRTRGATTVVSDLRWQIVDPWHPRHARDRRDDRCKHHGHCAAREARNHDIQPDVLDPSRRRHRSRLRRVGQVSRRRQDPRRDRDRSSTVEGVNVAQQRSLSETTPRDHRSAVVFTSCGAVAWIFLTASAMSSISCRGPRSIVCTSQIASVQSRSFCGHWFCSRHLSILAFE